MPTDPISGQNLISAGALAHIPANAIIQTVAGLTNISVESGILTNLNTPPTLLNTGLAYLVGSSPTGAWVGQAGKIAFDFGAWYFTTPREGFVAWDKAAKFKYRRSSSAWIEVMDLSPKLVILNPIAGDRAGLLIATRATTIRRVQAYVRGTGSPTVTIDIRHGTDPTAAGTALLTGTTVVISNTTSVQTITSFANPAVAAGRAVWLSNTAVGGTTRNELFVQIEATED